MLKKVSELQCGDRVKVCGILYSVYRTWREGEMYKVGMRGVVPCIPCTLTFLADVFIKVKTKK